MVCHHTPKFISLDIFELLITATQTNQTPNRTLKQTQTNKSNTQLHTQTNTNKQIKHSVTLPTHCSLSITVLSRYQAQRFIGTSLSLCLSLLYSSFLNLSFFTLFETQTSIFFSSSFSLFFSPHSETHDTVT